MNTSYPVASRSPALLNLSPPRANIFVAWIRQVMTKPKKEVSKARPLPVACVWPVWIATLRADPTRTVRVVAASWYDARSLAMAALGCEPGQLELREDNCDKKETAP